MSICVYKSYSHNIFFKCSMLQYRSDVDKGSYCLHKFLSNVGIAKWPDGCHVRRVIFSDCSRRDWTELELGTGTGMRMRMRMKTETENRTLVRDGVLIFVEDRQWWCQVDEHTSGWKRMVCPLVERREEGVVDSRGHDRGWDGFVWSSSLGSDTGRSMGMVDKRVVGLTVRVLAMDQIQVLCRDSEDSEMVESPGLL